MKKVILLCMGLILFASCEQDTIEHEIEEINDYQTAFAKGTVKVKVCHFAKSDNLWEVIEVSSKALSSHLNHGDVMLIDEDGDGWVSYANECVDGGDCDDTDPNVNPGMEEVCDDGIDNNCNGEIDENCGPTVPTVISANGRIWMDRNLGATQVATSSSDAASYGDLYQWGRGADGHEKRTSATTTILSSTDQPGHGDFITTDTPPYDWRSPQNDNLWQGANGINNPCPEGFRIPTEAEWATEFQSWSSPDAAGGFASPLKLPLATYRSSGGSFTSDGANGLYWGSTVLGELSRSLFFGDGFAFIGATRRAGGSSCRCIKD